MAVRVVESGSTVSISNAYVRIEFDLTSAQYSGVDVSSGITVFRDAEFVLDPPKMGRRWNPSPTKIDCECSEVDDAFGHGQMLRLTHRLESKYSPVRMLTIALYDKQSFVALGFGIQNPFDRPVRVARLDLLRGELMPGAEFGEPKVLRGGAGAEPNFVEDSWQVDAMNSAMLTCKVDNSRRTLVTGGLRYSEFARDVRTFEEKDGRRVIVLSTWDSYGKTIEPGETYISTDTMYLDMTTSDPFAALEAYGLAMRVANDAKPNVYDFPTLCGWMVSTQNLGEGKRINNSPGLVEQADLAEASGITKYTKVAYRLEPDYYCYAHEGDTQQGWWDNEHWAQYGSLKPPYETFEKFCAALRDRNGVPFTYFQASMPSNDFAIEHADWMLNNDISRLHGEHLHAHPFVRYDYTEPEFQEHVLNVWRRLRDAGLKGVKFDYPETAWAWNGGFEDKTATTTSAYRKVYELCREGLGDDAFIHERILGNAIHENVPRTDVAAGIVDLQRVWNDSSHFEPEMASRIGLRWYKSRSVFGYYPDGKSMITPKTREPLTTSQRRTFLTLIATLSGRLELGTSFGSMTAEMLHDVSRVYPAIPGIRSPRPVDMFTGKKHPEIYCYEVQPGWSQVVVCNNDAESKEIHVPIAGDRCEDGALGLDPDCDYYIVDFWNDRFIGRFRGAVGFDAQLHGCEALIFSVREALDSPQVISTNRHIMQGMLELHGVVRDGSRLSGSADVIADDPMAITIALNGTSPTGCSASAGIAELERVDEGLVRLILRSDVNCSIDWEITFS